MKSAVDCVERDEVISILSELVRIQSVNMDLNPETGNEGPVAEVIVRRLKALGFDVLTAQAQPGRPNVIAAIEGSSGSPSLLFNGHMDVLPAGSGWELDPFGAEIINGCLYGRGAEDMKAGLAAMLAAASAIVRAGVKLKGALVLNAVADEVSGGAHGSGFVVRNFILNNRIKKPEMAVICEPTAREIRIAHRGVVCLELKTSGKSAHGGRPWLGVNAISQMAEIIRRLETELPPLLAETQHPLLPSPNFNIGVINGGTKLNLVPDHCSIHIDRRTLPGETAEGVLAQIREVIGEDNFDPERTDYPIRMRKLLDVDPAEISPDERIVKECEKAYCEIVGQSPTIGSTAGFEDAHFFINAGIPTAMFGPYMCGEHAAGEKERQYMSSGSSSENVHIDSVVDAARIYVRLILNVLG